MEAVRATLGGVPLSLVPGGSIKWALTSGVEPAQQIFVVTTSRAEEIMRRAETQFPTVDTLSSYGVTATRAGIDRSGPLTLEVQVPGFPTLTVRGLYALQLVPAGENRRGIVVVDRRWLFSRQHLVREYNTRRFAGDAYLKGNEVSPIQVRDTQPDFVYRRGTLDNGVPWTARRMLEDVLTQLVGVRGFEIGKLQFSADVVDLRLNDSGTGALRRALAYLPGARVYVDPDGKIVVYDALDGGEGEMLDLAGTVYEGAPQVISVDRSAIRPKHVITLFDVEAEVRFDYAEEGTQTSVAGREPRILQNVVPIVDPQLEVNGKTTARGTWVPIDPWLDAVKDLVDYPGGKNGRTPGLTQLGALTQEMIRQNYLSNFIHTRKVFVMAQIGLPDVLWGSRLDAVDAHWRSTFRILPQWMDKIAGIRAVRAAIVDQETGTRAKSEAFFDHIIKPSRRASAMRRGDNDDTAWNIKGYAADLKDAKPGPANVVVLESESGTFQLQFKNDPWGRGVRIAPGSLVSGAPLQGASYSYLTWDSLKIGLAPNWKMSVVLTVLLASPNNQLRLHAESVSIFDASRLLPKGGGSSLRARGPDWKIRIGAAIQTARYAWKDQFASQIEESVFRGFPFPRELLVNAKDIRAIAEASAARIYAATADRWEGSQTHGLNPALHPAGSLSTVTHTVTERGTTTRLDLPPILEGPDIFALLPDSTRKMLERRIE